MSGENVILTMRKKHQLAQVSAALLGLEVAKAERLDDIARIDKQIETQMIEIERLENELKK
jgi:hypothetical protein